jgi:RNA polymerase sigma-70 factor (ECF subfamily)
MTENLFTDYRQWLFPVAYKMLGNRADAEDLVQETMLKWLSMEKKDIENLRGYLVRTLVNKCLNFLRDRRREEAKGDDLPETPVRSLPLHVEDSHSLSLGFWALLEQLTPLERAVLLLKEVFGYSHQEIAELLGITPVYARQLLARARRHLHAGHRRFEADQSQHLQLYEAFMDACRGQDLSELLEVLQEDIRIDRPAALAGRQVVAGLPATGPWELQLIHLFGHPLLLAWQSGWPLFLLRLQLDGDRKGRMKLLELVPPVEEEVPVVAE